MKLLLNLQEIADRGILHHCHELVIKYGNADKQGQGIEKGDRWKETVRSKEMLTDRRQVYTEWPEHKSKHSYSRNKDMDTKIITPLQTTAKSANDKHPYVVSCVCRVPHPSLLSLSLCFKCTSFVLSLSPSVCPLPLIIQDFKKGDRRSPVSVDNMLNTHTLTSLYPSSCQTNLWFHKRLSCLLCQLLKSLGKRLITPTPEALWGK